MVKMQNVILLSIKPEFAQAIFDGVKKIEFRRKIFKRPVDYVLLYSTNPVGKILGAISIKKIIKASPEELWNEYSEVGFINKKHFFNYFENCNLGYGLEIKKISIFNKSIFLWMIDKCLKAPQSYMYLNNQKLTKIEQLTGWSLNQ